MAKQIHSILNELSLNTLNGIYFHELKFLKINQNLFLHKIVK